MHDRIALALVPIGACRFALRANATDPVRELANDAYPQVSSLAMTIARETWAERADELMTNAPLSAKPGASWIAGASPRDAARAEKLATIDGWAKALYSS